MSLKNMVEFLLIILSTISHHKISFHLQKEDGSYSLNSKNILTSRFPTTFINLEEQRVSQSNLLAEHSSTRHQFLNIHLESIWNDNEDAPLYPVMYVEFMIFRL